MKQGGRPAGCVDVMVLINHNISPANKRIIRDLVPRLGYDAFIDLSDHFRRYMAALNGVTRPGRADANARMDRILEEVKAALGDSCRPDVLLLRKVGHAERILLRNVLGAASYFVVEEGWGSYRKASVKNVLNTLKWIVKFRAFGLLRLLRGAGWKHVRYFFGAGGTRLGWYRNMDAPEDQNLFEETRALLTRMSEGETSLRSRKVIVVGTMLADSPKMDIALDDEIRFYNQYLRVIKAMYPVGDDEIWFKPHPLTKKDTWERLSKEIDCRVYDQGAGLLLELEMANPELQAIFSVGSSALLYAKLFFGKKVYVLDALGWGMSHLILENYRNRAVAMGFELLPVPAEGAGAGGGQTSKSIKEFDRDE